MIYIMALFLLIWAGLIIAFYKQKELTRVQINFLPTLKRTYSYSVHPVVGQNVSGIVPSSFLDRPDPFKIVAITLPTCSYCSGAIEEFIVGNKKHQLPLMNILITEEAKDLEKYNDLFGKSILNTTASESTGKRLMISSYPTFLLVDKYNTVLFEEGRCRKIFNKHLSLLRGGEREDAKQTRKTVGTNR